MARKKVQADELGTIMAELKRVDKALGMLRWELGGKGGQNKPPTDERRATLEAKIAETAGRVAELRARRDALKAKA